jgi:S-adenosylmethionine/arginine decarboxylase-like enzyme
MENFTLSKQSSIKENKEIVTSSPVLKWDVNMVLEVIKTNIHETSSILNIAQIDCITNNSSVETVWGTKDSLFYQEKFENEKLEWMSSPIDIYDCNLNLIQSKQHIQQYIDELCRELKWVKIWATYMKYFDNEDPGITFKQRTNQWIVSAHFKDLTIGACIDIHSRTYYDPNIVAEYSKSFFEGWKTILDVSYREPINKNDNTNDIQTIGWVKSIDYYRKEYESRNLWWMSSAIDIHQCYIEKISSQNNMTIEEYIKRFVTDLCEAIDMVTDWDTQVNNITHHWKKWIEFTQIITTSLISGHFRNDSQSAYFEIFSCKFYDPNFVAQFIKDYFHWWSTNIQVSYRWIK